MLVGGCERELYERAHRHDSRYRAWFKRSAMSFSAVTSMARRCPLLCSSFLHSRAFLIPSLPLSHQNTFFVVFAMLDMAEQSRPYS